MQLTHTVCSVSHTNSLFWIQNSFSFSEARSLSLSKGEVQLLWLLNKTRQWHVFRFPPFQLRWAKDKAAGEGLSFSGSDCRENGDHWEGEEREARWAIPGIPTALDQLQHKHIDTSALFGYRFYFSPRIDIWTFLGNPMHK